jgi:hypothetical protein
VSEKKKQQDSKEFGIKLAKALRQRATEAASEHELDPRFVMLGAAEYLRKTAEFQLDSPIDPSQTDFGDRSN